MSVTSAAAKILDQLPGLVSAQVRDAMNGSSSDPDTQALLNSLTDTMATALTGITEGAVEDIRDYAEAIASGMAVAILTKNQAIIDELVGQLRLLAELSAVRVRRESQEALASVVKAVAMFAIKVLM